jgi:hypothetical protein
VIVKEREGRVVRAMLGSRLEETEYTAKVEILALTNRHFTT